MAQSALGDLVRFLHRVCAGQGDCDLTDRELLERYVSQRDESAFTFLVRRHGAMVFGVCRRLLGDTHEAEDVFQATFLVFVRRIASIKRKQSVGSWLYGVAQRIALRARAQAVARRRREREAGEMRKRASDELSLQDLRSVLDEEIGPLPEKYRAPVVLCYLEGNSYEQAARQLGCPKASLASRLARACQLLRRRLNRRGVTLTVAALTSAFAEMKAAAALPAMLTLKTVKAVALVATGKSLASCVSAGAVALAEEAMTGMLAIKGKLVVMVLALGLAVGGAGWAGYGGLADKVQPRPLAKSQPLAARDQVAGGITKKKPTLATDQYGDPLPEGALARLGALRFRHEGEAEALVFSADGKTMVGWTNSGVVIWDAATGKERYRLPGPMQDGGVAYGMDVSPDATTLAISDLGFGGNDAKISFWDLRTGTKARTISLPEGERRNGPFQHICFSPDGKHLAVSYTNDGKAVIFDVASGKARVFLGGRDSLLFSTLVVSPDSKVLAASVGPNPVNPNNTVNHKPGIQLLDILTGKLIRAIHDPSEDIYKGAIAYSPDGKRLAFGAMNGIFLSDPATGEILGQLEAPKMEQITGLAFTPDSSKLVSGSSDSKVRVWNVAAGKIIHTLAGRVYLGRSMALTPDGSTVALGSIGGAIQLWDVASGKELFAEHQGHDSQINYLAYSPDGKTLVSAGRYRQIHLWDTSSWKWTGTLPGSARTLSFSPDGKKLATAAGNKEDYTNKVGIWDVDARKEAAITLPDAGNVESVSFAPDGRTLFLLDSKNGEDGLGRYSVRQWDIAADRQDRRWLIPPLKSWVPTLAPNGKTVFGGRVDGGLTIYDAALGRKRLFEGQKGEWLKPMRPSLDGRVLAFGVGRSSEKWESNVDIRLCDAVTGHEIYLLKGHHGAVDIAWSPDGRLVATGDKRDYHDMPTVAQTVRLWDTATGKELARFGGFKADTTAMTFSPDGKCLAAGLRDGTILVFDVAKADPKLLPAPKLGTDALELCWTNLFGANATQAHQAIWTMVASAKESVPFLRGRLKPTLDVDAGKIQQWIVDLNSDKFTARQGAAKELVMVGEQVIVPIQKALKENPSLETRRRLEQILNNLPDVPGPETLRTIRAIMALERIGSPEAQVVLGTLARGAPGARETEEAKASLERLQLRMPRTR